ncbi:MAG: hypothetical protein HYU39_01770 [Thaumarchaeota archaeon]|nr:hypothetical protein [Nitrososphaerota archaeon]
MVLRKALDSTVTRVTASANRSIARSKILRFIQERWLLIAYLTIMFLLSSGVVNAILEGSRLPSNALPIIRRRGIQSAAETILYFLTYTFGAAGLFVAYTGAKQPVRRRAADLYLIVGLFIVVIGTVIGLTILNVKG